VDESRLVGIKEKLGSVKMGQINARLGKTGIFPNESFIRVVWVGLEDGKKITKLQQDIEKALEGMFEKDSRFHPHITLARIKFIENERKKGFVEAVKSIEVEPKEVALARFKLIKSTLTKAGPEYEVLEEFPA
jgi:2'-5' RNA ligase